MRTGIAIFSDVNGGVVDRFILGARERNLLYALVKCPNSILGRNELMRTAWPGLVISQNTLTVNMSRLRRVLKRIGIDRRIRTFANAGYSLECAGSYLCRHDGERVVVQRMAALPVGK